MKHLGWIITVFSAVGIPYAAQACDPAEPGVLTSISTVQKDLEGEKVAVAKPEGGKEADSAKDKKQP